MGVNRVMRWMATGPPAFAVRPSLHRAEFAIWAVRGRQGPPPHAFKEAIVKDYAARNRLETLVETGTYLGDMVWAVRHTFREIHTIELDPSLYRRAVRRFHRSRNVHVYQGDSAEVLGGIVAALKGPALFWLDGHYSGGITARGELDTPIRKELSRVFASPWPHVVLIDDASDFTGRGDYPAVDELDALLRSIRPGLVVSSSDNVIRIHQPPG